MSRMFVAAACDLFREVYEASGGLDGLVSIEVSPTLAHDTEGTIREAERLWHRVERANVMIKIPGTREGLPAITHCLAQGINVNVTLLFGVQRYREVVEAFMGGLEQRHRAGRPIGAIASVASFFVSRVDGKVPGFKAAIANAALAYQAFEELFATPRWQGLAAVGAMVQRHDNAPFRFHWADMQNVKNSIFGEEAWAVEYYPAAEQLVDQHNIYWMWIFPEGVLPLPTNPRAIPQTTPPDGEQQDRVV